MPPSEPRHRAAGETDTSEISKPITCSWQVQGTSDSQGDKPVATMFQGIYLTMIFLVCQERSCFLETQSKTLKQRASPAVFFIRNFKSEIKVRICSEPPKEAGKEIRGKPKEKQQRQIPLHSYQKTEVWNTQKLQPQDRNISWGSRPMKDWASVLWSASSSTQPVTDNLLMWELSQRSDVLQYWATEKWD